jgi:hypothetical protein
MDQRTDLPTNQTSSRPKSKDGYVRIMISRHDDATKIATGGC